MSKQSLIALFGVLSVAACGDDDGNGGNGPRADANTEPPMVDAPSPSACTQTIEAKATQFATQLQTASPKDATEMTAGNVNQATSDMGGRYRDELASHPGCMPRTAYGANTSEPFVLDNEAAVPPGVPAVVAGYPCAAKMYTQANEDMSKPIVILVHGNSAGVTSFEEYFKVSIAGTQRQTSASFSFTVDTAVREQLATKLLAKGYKVYGFDARTDRIAAAVNYSASTNGFLNRDHGWDVPMLQSFIKAVMKANPNRKVSVVGHSLGVTDIRDALRRLYLEHKAGIAGSVNPFAQLQDAIYLSGANHGVAKGTTLCDPTSRVMASTVACEMGDREAFMPTYFSKPNNGPGDIWSTPCADGDYAFGDHDACSGNVVQYTTVTMKDIENGAYQDEFVTEASSRLDMPNCVDNKLITLDDYDSSGYFFLTNNGYFASHFGSARSNAGMALILQKLAD
jgi:pimeloyl-ACP methyl ester carboxylesterase